jgi:hypothetical protein
MLWTPYFNGLPNSICRAQDPQSTRYAKHAPDMRREIDDGLGTPLHRRPQDLSARWVDSNVKLRDAIRNLSPRFEHELTQGDSFVAKMIQVKQIPWSVRANARHDRIRIATAIANGERLSTAEQLALAAISGQVDDGRQPVRTKGGSEWRHRS